jgi:DNA-binding MarR family transcriptional regulator
LTPTPYSAPAASRSRAINQPPKPKDLPSSGEDAPETTPPRGGTFQDAARHYEEEFGTESAAIAITLGLRRVNTLLVTGIDRFLYSLDLDVNMSGARLTLLRAIYFGDDHRLAINDLWRQMQVSRTNITNLIDSLERDGLVERVINPVDRRVIDAHLTSKGEELCAVVLPQIAAYMEGLCRSFALEELRAFGEYLARFQDELLVRVSSED